MKIRNRTLIISGIISLIMGLLVSASAAEAQILFLLWLIVGAIKEGEAP